MDEMVGVMGVSGITTFGLRSFFGGGMSGWNPEIEKPEESFKALIKGKETSGAPADGGEGSVPTRPGRVSNPPF